MYLYIDTRVHGNGRVGILDRSGRFLASRRISAHQAIKAGDVLKGVEALVRRSATRQKDLKGVVVEQGPGGFSSLRSGIVAANTLGFSLAISVIAVQSAQQQSNSDRIKMPPGRLKIASKLVFPHYGAEPSITSPRSGRG